MLGIDITRISRFKDVSESFVKKVLHTNEIKEWQNVEDKSLYLAKRFAIKEALYKANNSLFPFNQVELKVINRIVKYPGFIITTSHEDDYYIAMVMREK